jgi:hypothetical protein
MKKHKDGKGLESIFAKIQKNHKNTYCLRLYDTRTAMGGTIPVQPGDFIFFEDGAATIIECKDTSDRRGLPKKNIKKQQFAAQMAAYGRGVKIEYVVRVDGEGIWQIPFLVMRAFYESDEGVLTIAQMEKYGRRWA